MTALTSPKGPLPARVYWFRRVVLLAVVFLLVMASARLLAGSSDGKSDAGVRATTAAAPVDPSPSPDAVTGPTADAAATEPPAETTGKRGRKEQAVETPAPPPPPTPTGACTPEDVVVTPVVGSARPDGKVDMALVLRTRVTPACTWQVSADTVTVKIGSGSDEYWFSSQCPDSIPAQDVVVYQATDTAVPFVWSGRRSDEECSARTDWAMPGTYHVTAAAYAGEPTEVRFQRGRVSVTVTRAPEPEQEKAGGTSKKDRKKARQARRAGQPSAEPSGAVEPNG